MAFSINQVTLLGRCSQEPDLRYTANGTPVCTVNVATSYSYRDGEEWREVPEFSRCIFWRKAAEYVAQNLAKGQYIYVDGRLQTRKWETQEGQTRYTTEIVVRNFVLPKNKGESLGTDQGEPAADKSPGEEIPSDELDINEDIPF